jgi:hypothetical protein
MNEPGKGFSPEPCACGARFPTAKGRLAGYTAKQHHAVPPADILRIGLTMTPAEALTELGKVNERLRELDRMLRRALRDHPASRAAPLLQQEIADAMARKEWLLDQIQRMEKAGG